ncbi:MAG: hypothetical protein C4326_00625 [Ignavibacteria bacterium]
MKTGPTSVLVLLACAACVRAEEPTTARRIVDPIIDVRALVRGEMERAHHALQREAASPMPMAHLHVGIFFFAAGVSLLSTSMLLWVLLRRKRRDVSMAPLRSLPATMQPPRTDPVDALLKQAALILREKRAAHSPRSFAPVDEEVSGNVGLARTFQRGKGELALAQKCEAAGKTYPWEKKLREGAALNVIAEGSPLAAKTLGIGTGEMHLVHSLRALQKQHQRR